MRVFWIAAVAALVACRGKSDDDTAGGAVDAATDADGDGYDTTEDCDDASGEVYPGAAELCDGADNNCDGQVDEGVTEIFYADDDADGFGDPGDPTEACDAPSGHVEVSSDCDDADPDSHPGAAERCDSADNDCDGTVDEDVLGEWYADADGDGYGDADAFLEDCDPPDGYVSDATDCDDLDSASHPGGAEVCDEADNDCDGAVDEDVTTTYYQDADDDNYGLADKTTEACARPGGYASQSGDCDDDDEAVNPASTELCNAVDDDCDGATDEDDAADAAAWYADVDGDGYGDAGAAAAACTQPSGRVSDDTDCDDSTASANPGASEVCDSIDNDCDGETDEDSAADAATWYADADADGYGSTVSTVACDQPAGFADNDDDCDDSDSSASPAGSEVCDEADNDCDGTTDEGVTTTFYADSDGDGQGDPGSTTEACSAPSGYVATALDCDDGDATISPNATELCDRIDNDCDGVTDEDDAADAVTWYTDDDGDGYGGSAAGAACEQPSGTASLDGDCDDSDSSASPAGSEVCDEVDNDCDGSTDEGVGSTYYADDDGDGYGDPDDSTVSCSAPSGTVSDSSDCDDADAAMNPDAAEVCDGADNDCDGTADNDDEVYGDGDACAAESCDDILDVRSGAADGLYWIDPAGSGAFEVTCDMTTDGGGWTQVIAADSSEITASDPPDFTYTSSVWSSGYGSAGDSTHISEAWTATPSFSELMWIEGSTVYTETASTSGNLSAWSKTSGTVRLNELNSHSYGPYGGRVFRQYVSAICNTANSSTSWGAGLGPVRSCQHSFGTIYYEFSTYTLGFSTAELWVR